MFTFHRFNENKMNLVVINQQLREMVSDHQNVQVSLQAHCGTGVRNQWLCWRASWWKLEENQSSLPASKMFLRVVLRLEKREYGSMNYWRREFSWES